MKFPLARVNARDYYLVVRNFAIRFVSLAIAILFLGAPQVARPDDTRRIVLFGANWCVPCRMELKDLPELANAASPDQIVLAWIDRSPRVKLIDGVTVMPRDQAVALFNRISPNGSGLPLAVLFDGEGRPCATLQVRLRIERLAKFRAACSLQTPRS